MEVAPEPEVEATPEVPLEVEAPDTEPEGTEPDEAVAEMAPLPVPEPEPDVEVEVEPVVAEEAVTDDTPELPQPTAKTQRSIPEEAVLMRAGNLVDSAMKSIPG